MISKTVQHSALARIRLVRVGPRIYLNGVYTPSELWHLLNLGFEFRMHHALYTERNARYLTDGIGGLRHFHGEARPGSELSRLIDKAIADSMPFPFIPFPFKEKK